MKRRVSHSVAGIGSGGLVFAGIIALTVSCASSGRAAPVTGPEAEALFAALSGTWALDERESSPPMGTATSAGPDTPDSFVIIKGPGGSGQIIGASIGGESLLAGRENTLEVLARRPVRLVLRVDGERLAYTPTPGRSITVLISGAPTTQHEGVFGAADSPLPLVLVYRRVPGES